ncbi:hypothetical protein BKA67DRAFT_576066 [Truncatella angustata]|uniref:Uncharacterized protein n=1 Tax=Truncatella angustata TaxID=152316 RepID=A0A9P8ZU40_9PEZI|nr:uncharacterized protein BKA67DRAFT_576066 [Truncatella angustata]KAH6648862.1 hypothetical protein BKA67DRAFT_576066 [Truncatella angustata]
MVAPQQCQGASQFSYVVLLSGTHVTGKETLAVSLAKSLNCPWLKAEWCHSSANFGARSQARKGFDYKEVFGRIWFSKLLRIGFLSEGTEPTKEIQAKAPRKLGMDCTALITCFAMRKICRDAIRDVMMAHGVKIIFVIMQITKETLSGRTLGAEEPELAERIMEVKIADIEEPLEEEKDVVLVDSMRDVEALFLEMSERIGQQLALYGRS